MKLLFLVLTACGLLVARIVLGPDWTMRVAGADKSEDGAAEPVVVVVAEPDACDEHKARATPALSLTGAENRHTRLLLGWVRDIGEHSIESLDQPCTVTQ